MSEERTSAPPGQNSAEESGAHFEGPSTERSLADSSDFDRMPTLQALRLMNREDRRAIEAVERALPKVAEAADAIARRLGEGARLIYVGSGTSGRLGVLDAVECPPTFGSDPEKVQAVLAGGYEACYESSEGAEDDPQRGAADLRRRTFNKRDAVVGVSASGNTLYTLGAMRFAKRRKALTVAVTCNPSGEMVKVVDIAIVADTGPEVIAGSTRLKAATAQKTVLNMLSTLAMTRLGYVYGKWMINIAPSNRKLSRRRLEIVREAAGVSEERASELLERGGTVAVALVMARHHCRAEEARRLLESASSLRAALQKDAGSLAQLPTSGDRS
ncbi:MAG TPA: N-acetylmuramic acid 6-phosphate etherase [Acidobacteriota bacterium]|nr:N-acetylmuramic acid 6-phosphate etherase [Acidobacteriota bacterium]